MVNGRQLVSADAYKKLADQLTYLKGEWLAGQSTSSKVRTLFLDREAALPERGSVL